MNGGNSSNRRISPSSSSDNIHNRKRQVDWSKDTRRKTSGDAFKKIFDKEVMKYDKTN